jgi:hypothetical protein
VAQGVGPEFKPQYHRGEKIAEIKRQINGKTWIIVNLNC